MDDGCDCDFAPIDSINDAKAVRQQLAHAFIIEFRDLAAKMGKQPETASLVGDSLHNRFGIGV